MLYADSLIRAKGRRKVYRFLHASADEFADTIIGCE